MDSINTSPNQKEVKVNPYLKALSILYSFILEIDAQEMTYSILHNSVDSDLPFLPTGNYYELVKTIESLVYHEHKSIYKNSCDFEMLKNSAYGSDREYFSYQFIVLNKEGTQMEIDKNITIIDRKKEGRGISFLFFGS